MKGLLVGLVHQDAFSFRQGQCLEPKLPITGGFQTQVAAAHESAGCYQDRSFHRVLQLADVARPRVAAKGFHGPGVEAVDLLAVAHRFPVEETNGQGFEILRSFAQGRQTDLHRVETVEQILPKVAIGDRALDIRVGRREDPHVDLCGPGRTDALHLATLENAQQLRLLAIGQVGDLVQEERALVREFEAARPVALRVRERAPDMAEQLALEDAFAEPPGIHGQKRLRSPGRRGVQPLGNHLLARAVFPGDQYIGARRPNARHEVEYRTHGLGLRHELLQRQLVAVTVGLARR